MTLVKVGQQALRGPAPTPRIPRQKINVQTPCHSCRHTGLCSIEQQIEENLVLEIIDIGKTVRVAIDCSAYERAPIRRKRGGWTEQQRARFEATIAARKGSQ